MARHDPPVAAKLIYQMLVMLLSWLVLHARSNRANEIEILVLRHQLAVLQRRTPRPQIHQLDRPRRPRPPSTSSAPPRIPGHPATILSWHRHLVRRRSDPTDIRKIQQHHRLGGLLHEYQQVA